MYIHLGGDVTVSSRDIIGIFDIENTSVGKITRDYFKNAEKRRSVSYVSFDMPKAFVITIRDDKEKVFVSPVSSATLIKRAGRSCK